MLSPAKYEKALISSAITTAMAMAKAAREAAGDSVADDEAEARQERGQQHDEQPRTALVGRDLLVEALGRWIGHGKLARRSTRADSCAN